MAALTTAQTHVFGRTLVAQGGQLRIIEVTMVLSSQGGATNYIAASALGMAKILSSSPAQKSDDSLALGACPSYDGTKLFLYNLADATDATRDTPYDATGTFRVTVIGY